MIFKKRAQSEVITTVLLILIGIAAVAILSVFILNMVRTNLKGTECFEAMGQVQINLDSGWTFYIVDGSMKYVYVNVERETKDFELTGFNIAYGDDVETTKVTLKNGETTSKVEYVTEFSGGVVRAQEGIVIPAPGESKTYRISVDKVVTRVAIAPIIKETIECEKAEEREIIVKTSYS
jgi:flagellin-like protein